MKILAFGEVLLRMTVPEHLMLTQTDELRMSTVGTGVNLLSSLTHFGYRTRLLSRLPDNALGQRAAGELRRYGIQDDYVTFGGQHMGAYFVNLGTGRGRSGSLIRTGSVAHSVSSLLMIRKLRRRWLAVSLCISAVSR